MGGAVSTGLDNDELIDNLMQAQYIKTPEIERVFRAVDRAAYFLPEFQMNAYKDLAWKSGNIHISAPCIYSAVMENLKLEAGMSFLNIGSGTGYLSTMAGLILGPFGVNHGIEMHADVLKYAYEKLHEFKKSSAALDCFEFCDPVFVKGNGLCLPSDIRQYDRVYCGAACPENHENYVKNIIKVGGLLVMPQNDQLLQITRISQTQWESKNVLPVSFSTLQLPNTADSKNHIALPDTEPISLQAVCRSCIRRTLRCNAEREYPQLTKPRPKRSYPRKKRALRNLVIPFLESSDDELDSVPGLRQPTLVIGGQARITAVFDIGRALHFSHQRRILRMTTPPTRRESQESGSESAVEAVTQRSEPETSERKESATETDNGESSDSSQPRHVPKREKFDSGVVDDIDNGKGLTSSDEENEGPDHYGMTSDEETMEVDSDSDFVYPQKSEDEGVEEDLPKPKKGSGASFKREKEEPEFTYTSVMRDKIKSLPLPPLLKTYVNLNREF